MKKPFWILIMVLALVFNSGCAAWVQQGLKSDQESHAKEGEKTQKKEENKTGENSESLQAVPIEIPSELKGLKVLAGPGKYAGDRYDEQKVKEELQKLSPDLSPEEVYDAFLELLAEDYRSHIDFFENYDTSMPPVDSDPDGNRPKLPENKEVNVTILLDASGSMAEKVNGGVKMDLAKKAVRDFAGSLPEGTRVSLVVYGHKGSNSAKDKKLSCGSIEEVYPLSTFDSDAFQKSLDQFKPAGWTPLADAMEKTRAKLASGSKNAENIVYVVSDGVETCDGDPVQAAKSLNRSDIKAVVNIIGFDVDHAGQKALKAVADAGGGTYKTVDSQKTLENHFQREKNQLLSEWYAWESRNLNRLYKVEDEKLDELYREEKTMIKKTEVEEQRMVDLAYWLEKQRDMDLIDVRNWARNRGLDLRNYARGIALDLRNDVRDQALTIRNEVRGKALDKRNEIRNQD